MEFGNRLPISLCVLTLDRNSPKMADPSAEFSTAPVRREFLPKLARQGLFQHYPDKPDLHAIQESRSFLSTTDIFPVSNTPHCRVISCCRRMRSFLKAGTTAVREKSAVRILNSFHTSIANRIVRVGRYWFERFAG